MKQPRTEKEEDTYPQSSLSYKEVKELRDKHFASSISLSYSNSNPLLIVSGSKCRLIDHLGTPYLDTRNNVCHVGHQHPHVVQKVQEQLAILNTNTRYLHPNATWLAHRLCELLPDPLQKVFFVNSGSEANDLALRLAKATTLSSNFICVDHAYHGHTLSVLEVSPYKYKQSQEFLSCGIDGTKSPGNHIMEVPCPDTYRGVHRGDDAGDRYAEYVVEACEQLQSKGETLAAMIVEGGMSVGGVILPPKGYLSKCANTVQKSMGGLFIADEVQTGFGRLGHNTNWAFQYQNKDNDEEVIPDIVTIGKPFGNGMPLAAVVTTQSVSDAFDSMNVEYFNTFGGNPVCTAAGLAVLDVIENEHLKENATKVGGYLKNQFQTLQQEQQDEGSSFWIGDVRGSGLFLGIELIKEKDTLDPATCETSMLCSVLKETYKILTSIDGPYENVLVVKPPMVFSVEDADEFVSAFRNATRDVSGMDLSLVSKTPT